MVSSGEPNEVMKKSTFSSQQTFNCSLYKKLDLSIFYLKVDKKNIAAIKSYKKSGFFIINNAIGKFFALPCPPPPALVH